MAKKVLAVAEAIASIKHPDLVLGLWPAELDCMVSGPHVGKPAHPTFLSKSRVLTGSLSPLYFSGSFAVII